MAMQKSSKPADKGPQSLKTSVKKNDSWNSPYVYWAIFVIVLIFLGGLVYWYFNKEGSLFPEKTAQELSFLAPPVEPELPPLSKFSLPTTTPDGEGALLLNETFSVAGEASSSEEEAQGAPDQGSLFNEEIIDAPSQGEASSSRGASKVQALDYGTPPYVLNTPPTPRFRIQPQGPSEMEKLIMQRVVLDDMLRKVEEGGPFILDLDIMHKWIKDPEPRQALLAIEPYAHNGIGSLSTLIKQARTILIQNQEEKPSEKDHGVSRFLKSIVRVSKKSDKVPQLEKALQAQELNSAVLLAEQLIKEGYPLESWLDKLKNYIRSKEEIEKARNIIHSYIRKKLLEVADSS